MRVVADNVGVGLPAVGKRHLDPLGAMHDVAVGQDEPVRRDDKARAAAQALARPAAHFDIYDRRPDFLGGADHGPRVGIQQSVVRRRRRRVG